MTFENDNYKLCLPHVFPPSFITASHGRALKTAISKLSPNDPRCLFYRRPKRQKEQSCSSGRKSYKHNSHTGADERWNNFQLKTMLNSSALPPTWGPTLFILWCGTFRLFWLQTSKSPSITFFYTVNPKLYKGRMRLVHQAPVSLQQRPHRAALKKELITKSL